MWAHYAGSHKGIVLGFDVPEKALYDVDYVKKRPTLTDMGLNILDEITPEDIKRLIRTKADGWPMSKNIAPTSRSKTVSRSIVRCTISCPSRRT
ncbi:hypothetical protein X732_04175 [Mesorhizobium sp. L2C066B000]|nr:hypothetical protein X732_04175 [Mesorhizobium sp. L2C066B000]